jgi:hypothetical protein
MPQTINLLLRFVGQAIKFFLCKLAHLLHIRLKGGGRIGPAASRRSSILLARSTAVALSAHFREARSVFFQLMLLRFIKNTPNTD